MDPHAQAVGFRILSLTLMGFRNYEHLSLSFTPDSVVFTGANGAGKTNILEALSYLRIGRGLRGSDGEDVVCQRVCQRGDDKAPVVLCGVSADVEEPQGLTRRAVEWRPDKQDNNNNEGWRKTSHREGALNPHDDSLPMLWLVPGADRYSGANRAKRQMFFDQLISAQDKDHSRRLARYDKTMRERTKVLRNHVNHINHINHGDDSRQRWLTALEERMAQEALAIAATRKLFTQALNDALDAYAHHDVQARTEVRGFIEDQLDDHPALYVEEIFCQKLQENRSLDALKGRAEVGIHRSTFMVWDKKRQLSADLCSTGQQKMLTLLVVLAAASLLEKIRSAPPILLLDEVAAHLDNRNAHSFFQLLHASRCQAWMSGLSPALFADIAPNVQGFDIEAGRVHPWSRHHRRLKRA